MMTVEQATIVVGATCVFHKRSHVEFAKVTRVQKKELARWQKHAVDMAIRGSYEVLVESRKRTSTAGIIRHNPRRLPSLRNIRSISRPLKMKSRSEKAQSVSMTSLESNRIKHL
jgi:hypothetical protein